MGLISVVRLHLRWYIIFLKLTTGSEIFLFGATNTTTLQPDKTQHSQQLDRAANGNGVQKINQLKFN